MEFNANLMLGFARRVKILDQEVRATHGAMEHAVAQWGKDNASQKEQFQKNIREQVKKQMQAVAQESRKLPENAAELLTAEGEARQSRLQMLTQCRTRLAQLETAEMGILHGSELAGKEPAGSSGISLDSLLRGEPDFVKLVGEINELYRSGKTAKAKQAYANFREKARIARELLGGRITEVQKDLADGMAFFHERLENVREGVEEQLESLLDDANLAVEQAREGWAETIREQADSARFARMELDMKLADRNTRIRDSFQEAYPSGEMEESSGIICQNAPDKEGYQSPERMPQQIWLGNMSLELAAMGLHKDTMTFLNRNYPFLLRNNQLVMPYGAPFRKEFNSCFSYGEAERPTAVREARNLAMRLYMAHRPGEMRVTFADPVTLGESFALFGKLVGDREENNLIGGQIWASPADIHRQIQNMVSHIADVNQRCLQGQFASLEDYNRESFSPEGYRVLMLMDYPAGLNKDSLELLERIVRLGPKCGVFTMVMRSKEQYQKAPEANRKLVDQLDKEFRKWTVRPDQRVVFDGMKLSGQEILWNSGTELSQEETDWALRGLRSSYGLD